VNVVTVSPEGSQNGASRELVLRVVSAAVLIPAVVAAVIAGSPFFEMLVALVVGILAFEWDRLCGAGKFRASGVTLGLVVLSAVAATALGHADLALYGAVAGAVVVFALARWSERGDALWSGFGALYIGLPAVALVWLRQDGGGQDSGGLEADGLVTILWLMGVVWVTDTGAFFCGRAFGRRLLAPRISPKKTWAGVVGGVAMAVLLALFIAWGLAFPLAAVPVIVGASVLASLATQGGDLFESLAKRRFGVKDSGGLIPGHGGLLDRVDGLLVAAPAVAVIALAAGGGVLAWR
jgi:phosphatidate cytidylyltransferase